MFGREDQIGTRLCFQVYLLYPCKFIVIDHSFRIFQCLRQIFFIQIDPGQQAFYCIIIQVQLPVHQVAVIIYCCHCPAGNQGITFQQFSSLVQVCNSQINYFVYL
ncbi:hypothetical protein D3C87_1580210 [compost metagenome]